MRTKRYIFLLLIFNVTGLMAQTSCLDEVKNIYLKMKSMGKPKGKQAFHFVFQVNTEYWAKNKPSTGMQLDMVYSKDFYSIKSDRLEMYMDQKEAFTLVPQEKKVFWSDSMLGLIKDSVYSPLKVKFFDMVEKYTCSPMANSSRYNQIITLDMNQQAQKKYFVKSVVIYYDSKEGSFYKTAINYIQPYMVAKVEFTYSHLDYNFKANDKGNLLKKKIFRDNKLSPAFASYQLVDARQSIVNKKVK